jgi:hypothetical protein
LLVTVLLVPASVVALNTQVLPTAIGNGSELDATTDDVVGELDVLDGLDELGLLLAAPPAFDDPPELEDPPHAESARPATARQAMTVPDLTRDG